MKKRSVTVFWKAKCLRVDAIYRLMYFIQFLVRPPLSIWPTQLQTFQPLKYTKRSKTASAYIGLMTRFFRLLAASILPESCHISNELISRFSMRLLQSQSSNGSNFWEIRKWQEASGSWWSWWSLLFRHKPREKDLRDLLRESWLDATGLIVRSAGFGQISDALCGFERHSSMRTNLHVEKLRNAKFTHLDVFQVQHT